jgi:high affinity Mn2+ porin
MKLHRALLLSLLLATAARAQPTTATEPIVTTLFPHSEDAPFLVAGQMNLITQYHPTFRSPYSGAFSLSPQAEAATSFVATLYTGFSLARWTEGAVHVEMAAGGGIGQALGLAGFTNMDVVRNPTLGAEPYLARIVLRQVIPLSEERTDALRTPLGLATSLPTRRLEFHVGKMSTADFFDVNSVGSDSHLQFMNWTVDSNGGYDYAADTRGYTWGAVVEYVQPEFAVRFGEMLMPTVANGLNLDFDVSRARAENLEVELHHGLIPGRLGIVRLLGYLNHANMGSYREAIDAFRSGAEPVPDIEAHRRQGRRKYGFGLNLEQEVVGPVRAFARAGWNEGENESFAFTEVNDTVALGGDVRGTPWSRPLDKVALAVVSNGLSTSHREYLALGGHGFVLGDGRLDYGRENILEAYYNAHLWRGLYAALDFQHISHPGYNRDRGPVNVGSFRLHLDL